MQAIWKGTISFGMVTIPIKVYSATEERDISFRQVHTTDSGRIRYKRFCEVCGEEVPYSDIGKGYELPDGRMVVLTSEDFAELPLPTAKSIEVLEFVPIDEVDPLFFSKAYYLATDGAVSKSYVLFRDALTNTDQCAVVKVALRTRESLALLREKDGVLVLQTMLWPDEVRDSSFAVPDDADIKKQEVAMAESYISTLSTEFDPSRYSSDYREALEALVEAKSQGVEMPEAEEQESGAQVVDLVAALRASVEAAKQRRGEKSESDSSSDDTDSKPAASATKKTASKSSAKTASSSAKNGKSASSSSKKAASSRSKSRSDQTAKKRKSA
jgi:DNA end-binding protein Ku